jgi:acetyl-CoA C-acetyltransferase
VGSLVADGVVLLGGARTPIGSFLGSLAGLSAPQLGSIAIKAALDRSGVAPENVDEVIFGNVLSAGVGQAPARQAALGAGLPTRVPCMTINKVCGSGMKAAMLAGQSILLGESSVVVAGGMESMSQTPYLLDKARTGYRMGNAKLVDSMINDGLWDPYKDCHMGSCADATSLAEEISRTELDEFAAESYRRALRSMESGLFDEEIVPVSVAQRKGPALEVGCDEEPSKGDPSKLARLRPAFGEDGTTTAGNASSLNDGACALVLSSKEFASSRGLTPIAHLVGWTSFAQEPQWFTTAPASAVERLLAKFNLTVEEVDLFEVNEAFAVVALAVAKRLSIPSEKLNVNGGAVALGHPIGMTGARLILTAALELRRRGGRYAIATPCIGGGEATAVLLENPLACR